MSGTMRELLILRAAIEKIVDARHVENDLDLLHFIYRTVGEAQIAIDDARLEAEQLDIESILAR